MVINKAINYAVFIRDEHYQLVSSLFDHGYHCRMEKEFTIWPTYGDNSAFTSMVNCHMLMAFLMGRGYGINFNTNVFYDLCRHKHKLYFEFKVDVPSKYVRLEKIIYDEHPDRMGIIIKKAIIRACSMNGFGLAFEEKLSKQAKKSFFRFT